MTLFLRRPRESTEKSHRYDDHDGPMGLYLTKGRGFR